MIGRQIDRFRIVGKLGQGGMGSVWKAEDTLLHRPVALKILSEEWVHVAEARRRFLREARAASALSHPGVATVYGAGEAGPDVFIALALIEGETVSELAAREPFAIGDAVRMAIAVAEALAHAHARGVVHRDITGRNVMIDRDGRVFVLDFGLAAMSDSTQLTTTMTAMGTAAYVAPEVVLGHGADPRADLYGLGVVLFEALTGSLPFAGERTEGLLYAAVHEPAPAPSTRRTEVPAWLDAIVLRLLVKSPGERYPDADALLAALREHAREDAGVRVTGVAVRGAAERAEAAPARPNAVLVAPVRAAGADPGDARDAGGLTDAVHAALSAFHGLEVMALDDPEAAGDGARLRGEARRLGARFTLAGSLRRAGDRLRLAWTLTDAATGTVVAGDTCDGAAGRLFELEDRWLDGVRSALRSATGLAAAASHARDPHAHRTFLEALAKLKRSDSEIALDEAIAMLERLNERGGDTASVNAALGRAYLKKHQLRSDRALAIRAAEACQRAIALDPHMPDVFVTLGDLHLATGRLEESIAEFERALELRAQHPDALAGLALAAMRAGRFETAEDAARALIAARPDDWLGYNRLGALLYRQGRYALAIEPWKHVTRLSPDNPMGHANLASALFATGRLDEALASYQRAVALEPTPYGHAGLGTVLFYQGRFADSARAFEQAIALLPNDPALWGNLANACDELPDGAARAAEARDRAIALMLERLELNPHDAEGWLMLAGWRADRGQRDLAREAAERALALAPADPSVHARAAVMFEAVGERERALALFERARAGGYAVDVLAANPSLAALRSDPRFQRLLDGSPAPPAESVQSHLQTEDSHEATG
ncbi:MAG TPA: tetratricopeptide repeat protein [Candidatus Eisenbacteria bacterium]|nr:tetratricopeptide repeat protein [Candidatus Eisenbacteria bacterium]